MPSILNKILRIISVLIALGLVLTFAFIALFNYYNSAPDTAYLIDSGEDTLRIEEGAMLYLEVRNGESALSVGKRLRAANVIRSEHLWNLISRLKNEFIKTGTYRIELPSTQLAIHSMLVSGDQLLLRVTIPEGATLKKASVIFEEAGICSAEDFMAAAFSGEIREHYRIPGQSMEGYLFPDTYFFPLAFPAEKVVRTMADTFFLRLTEIAPEALALGRNELNDRIILASIIEREYRVNEEAALMAGVFYNRLRINMALQSCATVEYIITEIQGRAHPAVLYNRDLEIQNPYNTYLFTGLPPGPISAPGAVAIDAVFNPTESSYFYFRLTDPGAGRHYFSRTLDDHIQAGALYLKGN